MTAAARSPYGGQLAPADPVGVRWPKALSEGGALTDEEQGRCPPRSEWLWPGYHCPLDKELRRAYGITCETYWRIFDHQNGVCGVCGKPPKEGRRLVVDEADEAPFEIRGLLHHPCNRKITRLVRLIARYLASPPAREVGPFYVSADRRRRRLKRLDNKRRARRAKAAAARQEPPAPPGDYAAKVAAVRSTLTRGR